VRLRHDLVTPFAVASVTVDVYTSDTAAVAALAGEDPAARAAREAVLASWTGDVLPDDRYANRAFQARLAAGDRPG
jgi:hypothetical protein